MKPLNQSISLSYIYSLSSSRPGVDELSVVVDNSLDKTLLLKESDGTSGEGTVDLHSVDEDGLRNKLVGGDLLEDSVAGQLSVPPKFGSFLKIYLLDGLVNDNGIVGLVLHLALAPLLLLTVNQHKSVPFLSLPFSHIQHNPSPCPLEALGMIYVGGG